MPSMLKAALWYSKQKMAVIPIKTDKRPFIKWEQYQSETPTEDQIRTWWTKWPKANVGIVTGKISNLIVIDIDTDEGNEKIEELLPSNLETPMSTTPSGGKHIYFSYQEGISNSVRFLEGCDIRSQGGYIIAPPSRNGNGNPYAWIDAYKINKTEIAVMPEALLTIIKNFYIYSSSSQQNNNPQHSATNVTISLEKGGRDHTLFHMANCLIKGGMQKENTEYLLSLIAKQCNPPFPESEAKDKIESALKRYDKKIENLTQAVRDYISVTWGNISVTQAQQDVTFRNIPEERAKIRTILGRLVTEGLIERVENQNGVFRKVEETVYEDWINAETSTLDVRLPFGMERYVDVYPGDVIVIAGVKSAGKTALALEMIRLNMQRFETFYHSSELVKQTFRLRVSKSNDTELSRWAKVKMSSGLSMTNAKDRVEPDGFNVFDYIESDEGEYYKIAGTMAKIHRELNDGVAVICLQKNKDKSTAAGGEQTKNKANLYLLLDKDFPHHVMKIDECKAFKNNENPEGFIMKYKIVDGINIIPCGILEPAMENSK